MFLLLVTYRYNKGNKKKSGCFRMDTVQEFCRKYYVNRKGTQSLKWDGVEGRFGEADLFPLWVADMDFKVPERVQHAMIERIEHGTFGYSFVPKSYFKAFNQWHLKRHGFEANASWFRFCTGVVNAFNYVIQSLTQPDDSVLILSPVYYPFYDAVTNNGCQLVVCELTQGANEYHLDMVQFEQQICQNDVKVFLHCSPQNPVGKVWSPKELTQMFEICYKYNVKIISDEIHQDFMAPGQKFTSALMLDEKYYPLLYVLNAPSKTFNLASLLHSHIIIPDKKNRVLYDEYAKKVSHNPVSIMGMIATEASYLYGEEWFEGLLKVIDTNHKLICQLFAKHLPMVRVMQRQATYLSWIDLSAYVPNDQLIDIVQRKAKLAVDYGEWFGENGHGFIRINLATSPENIEQAILRLITEIK
ncbi:hypothetical protein CBF34_04890 [Vagococcus penaei]|nr:hypothetical protein CBF34_04890 [Vagococcus penaei]